MSTAGGIVVRFDPHVADAVGVAARAFLPATIARRVARASGAIALGGASALRLGLASVEGRLLTLVSLGAFDPRGPVVICERPAAEPFALGVLAVVASGVFEALEGGVDVDGDHVPHLDVMPLLETIEAAVWVQRAGRPPSSAPPPSSARPAHRRPR